MGRTKLQETFSTKARYEHVRAVAFETWRYPEFISNISSAELLQSSESVNEVRFHAFLFMPFVYTVRTEEIEPGVIEFTQSIGLGEVRGRWEIRRAGDGAGCDVTYQVEATLPPLVPDALLGSVLRLHYPKMLQEFKKEIEARMNSV